MSRHPFPQYGLLAVGMSLMMAGCGLLNELLPTSSDADNGAEPSSEPTSASNASGSSPSTPTPYPSPTTGITAPDIQSPSPGSEVTDARPTLVVSNAVTEDKAPVYYTFEVSRDEAFSELVATARGVPEGRGPRTSWQVPSALSVGRYFWRARAQVGFVKSTYSDVADFQIIQVQSPPEPGGGDATVFDPLTDGVSVGEVHGGEFTPEGWKVTSRSDFIRYEIQPLQRGFVEWENMGLQPTNPSPDQFMLFGMWDPTQGDYRTNPFRVHIQKLDTNHNPPYIRLRWISNGEQHDKGFNFKDWDPDQSYQWRIEWGPEGNGNEVRVFLDGQIIIQQTYQRRYLPNVHWVELGIAERVESIVGAIYANLRIGSP